MIFIRWHRFATEIVLQSIESTFLKLMQSLRSASLPATHFSDSISVTTNILNATANIDDREGSFSACQNRPMEPREFFRLS